MKKCKTVVYMNPQVCFLLIFVIVDSDDKVQMIKELNDSLTRRVLKECFDLPEVLYACFQRSIFNFFYNNRYS